MQEVLSPTEAFHGMALARGGLTGFGTARVTQPSLIRLYSRSRADGEAVSGSSTCVAWMVKGEGSIDRALHYANQLKKRQILVREPTRWFAVTG